MSDLVSSEPLARSWIADMAEGMSFEALSSLLGASLLEKATRMPVTC